MYILLPFVVMIITLLAMLVVLSLYCEYDERKHKAKFKAMAQRKVFIGTREQLERLREWGNENGY